MLSKRSATLAGVLALSALFALVTLSAVSSGPRRYALEGEEPMQGEDVRSPNPSPHLSLGAFTSLPSPGGTCLPR